ncbi:MAG: ABC transporter ATP-binding protein [Flavobacteriaceae bacterium]|nr:ABC transporter ATP-binding protein [Flavobacteriaceae bacterium]
MGELIKIEGLTYKVGSKTVLDDITFDVIKGEKYLILGHNGSGKSSLIDCILDNVRYRGTILKNEINKDRLGILYDQFSALPLLKVKEILKLLECVYSTPRNNDLISSLTLEPLLNKYFYVLSKGERKKVGLYASLFVKSDLLILDEPTDGLDPEVRDIFWNIIRKYKKTVLLTTHLWEEAKFHVDKIIFLESGKILSNAETYDELMAKFPYKGKIVTNSTIKYPEEMRVISIDKQSFIYFKNQNEKKEIIRFISQADSTGYSVFQIDLRDIYVHLKSNE